MQTIYNNYFYLQFSIYLMKSNKIKRSVLNVQRDRKHEKFRWQSHRVCLLCNDLQ